MTKITPAKEPVVWIGAVVAVAAIAAQTFLHLSPETWRHILEAAPVVVGLVGRVGVMPTGKPLGDIITLRAGQATEAIASAQAELDAIAKLAAAFAPVPAPVVVAAPAVPAAPVVAEPPAPHVAEVVAAAPAPPQADVPVAVVSFQPPVA